MERKNGIKPNGKVHDNVLDEQKYFAGPLNLNRDTKQASTVMGIDITLGEMDFEALDLMVRKEGEYLTFQQLYDVSWGTSETTKSVEFATAALDNLITQLNSTGDEFMWVESTPEMGYKFSTRWGQNWSRQNEIKSFTPRIIENITAITAPLTNTGITRRQRRFSPDTLLAGAGALVAALMLVLLLLYSTGVITPPAAEPLYIEVEDPGVPLAAPNFED